MKWESFQSALLSSLSNGRGKWAPVLSSNKTKRRTIFNNRRLAFDVEAFGAKSPALQTQVHLQKTISSFVSDMLTLALSLDQNSLEEHPDKLLKFLNMTSSLQVLPLGVIDLTSQEAFCIFVNLFHCLLQHSLLLAVLGPPNRVSS